MDRIDEIKECRKTTIAMIGHEPEIRVPVDLFDWIIAQLEEARKEIHGLKATKESAYNAMSAQLEEAERELARVQGMVAETLSLATDYALRCSEEKNCAMYKIILALSDGKTQPESEG